MLKYLDTPGDKNLNYTKIFEKFILKQSFHFSLLDCNRKWKETKIE